MDNVECPYCGETQEINHDDGAHYDENESETMECSDCDKTFMVSVWISRTFEGVKVDCLNDGKHIWRPTNTIPRYFTRMKCETCDEKREFTEEEKIKYNFPKE